MSKPNEEEFDVAIIGAGFTGLSAGLALSKRGYKVCVIDESNEIGGLASNFQFNDSVILEKFYHHWFNSDKYVDELTKDLGVESQVIWKSSKTGMFFNGKIWRLSSPLDLLRFKAISFWARIRLGLATLYFPLIRDWKKLEGKTIRQWLEPIVGVESYAAVWAPLVNAKFSTHSESVNAVWMWKKLALRGGTRNKKGGEELAYFEGGFGKLAQLTAERIVSQGGYLRLGQPVAGVNMDSSLLSKKRISSLNLENGEQVKAKSFLFTPSFEICSSILGPALTEAEVEIFNKVEYLGNICLVLQMKKSLSDTYWLNVNDPGFPFVGVIEHTNLDKPESFDGSHIAYLSRYIDVNDPDWNLLDQEYFEMALYKLVEMFPGLERGDIISHKIWRSRFAQPIAGLNYSSYLPGHRTSIENSFFFNMAQIYPEDRGTNYAIREGREAADQIDYYLKDQKSFQ